jgi:hypothetical protein
MRIPAGIYWIAIAFVAAVGGAVAVACSNDAVGVQACRQIETARCEAAPGCPSGPFNLEQPVPAGDPVAACVRYYNDACLHGIITTVTPGSAAVNTCVAAIVAAGKAAAAQKNSVAACRVIEQPWNTAYTTACEFLTADAGTPVVVDAGEDAGADATTD